MGTTIRVDRGMKTNLKSSCYYFIDVVGINMAANCNRLMVLYVASSNDLVITDLINVREQLVSVGEVIVGFLSYLISHIELVFPFLLILD